MKVILPGGVIPPKTAAARTRNAAFFSSPGGTALGGAAIALSALLAYHGSLAGPFVFDDVPGIVHNPSIRPLGDWLSPPANTTVSGRPMVNLSLALNYAISGTGVWSYHALNLTIHILAGLTLFGIARRTLQNAARARRSPPGGEGGPDSDSRTDAFPTSFVFAFAVALLWTLHPLQTESVTYIIQRAESLMGLFYLLTLYCFIRAVDAGGEGPDFARWTRASTGEKAARRRSLCWFGISWLGCFFGMATKEVMVSAPVIVLLYDRTFVAGTVRRAWQLRRGFYCGLAASWLLLIALVAGTSGRAGTAGFATRDSWWAYGLTQGGAILRYLGLSLWPHPLVFDYGPQLSPPSIGIIAAALLVLMGLAGTVWALLRLPAERGAVRLCPLGFGGQALGFAGAWFFAILAPSSSVVPIATEAIAEHRMYLPLAAVVALAVASLFWVAGNRGLLVAVGLAVGLGFITARRNQDYRSALALWTDTISRRPENPNAWCNRGIVLDQMGRVPEAIADFSEALRLAPGDPEAQNDLAVDCVKTGRFPEAIAHGEEALRLAPDYAEAHATLAAALAGAGRWGEAIGHYRRALELDPKNPIAEDGLGLALSGAGRVPEAIAHFGNALRIDPAFAKAHYDWGSALAHSGKPAEAMDQDRAALRLDPGYAEAHTNLAIVLAQTGKVPEAVAEFQAALRLQPGSAAAHRNLGLALRSLGRAPEAEIQFAEAARIEGAKAPAGAPSP